MESIIIIGLIVALLAWIFYFRKLNPENKTDSQLTYLYRMALKTQLDSLGRDPDSYIYKRNRRDLEILEAEMKKRGLI